MDYEFPLTKEQLHTEYVINKKSVAELSVEYDVSKSSIYRNLEKFNIPSEYTKHYVGKKQGILLLVDKKLEYEENKLRPKVYFYCKCGCGTERWYPVNTLNNQNKNCCGCTTLKKRGYIMCGEITHACWYLYETNARRNNRQITITPEFIWDLYLKQNKKCYYTGLDISFKYKKRKKEITASIDRIDNTKDYFPDNVRLVHKCVNILRGCSDHDIFVYLCNKVTELHPIDTTVINKELQVSNCIIKFKE